VLSGNAEPKSRSLQDPGDGDEPAWGVCRLPSNGGVASRFGRSFAKLRRIDFSIAFDEQLSFYPDSTRQDDNAP
jgi:hypothetical protein